MSKPEIPGDYQLWRDYDWEKYLESELPKYPTPRDKQELIDVVHIVKEFVRVMSANKLTIEDSALIESLERKFPQHTFVLAVVLLAQIGGIYYKAKRLNDDKLDFAITAIAKAAQKCKDREFDKVFPILTRFAKEFGNE